jgi:hypothetical protein
MLHLQNSTFSHLDFLIDRSNAVAAAAFPFSDGSTARAAAWRASMPHRWQAPKCRREDPEQG